MVSFQRKVGPNGSIGDIDVETSSAIIEVTVMKRDKLGQIQKLMSNRDINPTGKPVILYAPSYGKFSTRDIINAGAYVAKTESELKNLLNSLRRP